MNRLTLKFVLFAMLFITGSVRAQWTATTGTVNQVVSAQGFLFVLTDIADSPCGTTGKFWWPKTSIDSGDMYALSLTAFSLNKKIRVVYDETAPNCLFGGAEITHMSMIK